MTHIRIGNIRKDERCQVHRVVFRAANELWKDPIYLNRVRIVFRSKVGIIEGVTNEKAWHA